MEGLETSMPRLLQVRMSNIILDEGKKVIPDLTWSPDGRDMLFILENGGGKTSVIQLMMQTILPNVTLTGRKMKETVAKRSNGHIATSWRLDGDQPKYAVFGFSYVNANSESEDLQYFNYYFTHSDDSPLTIETLPMVVNGKLTNYTEYKRTLQRAEGVRVRIPETNEQYKMELQQFQILVEEWKNMQKINGDEGGVAEFFAKAKTVEDLIKKLLIPSIEDTIFQRKEDKEGIFESFKGFKDNLLRIPELKQDIRDFGMIQDNADSVITSVETYQNMKKAFFETQNRLVRLKKTFHVYKEELQEVNASVEQEIQELNARQNDWLWIKDSYLPQQTMKEIISLQNKLQSTQEKVALQTDRLQTEKQHHKEARALYHYGEYKMFQRERQTYQTELDAFELSHAELMKQLEEAKRVFQNAWYAELQERKEKEGEVKEKLCVCEVEMVEAKQIIKEIRQNGNVLTKENAEIQAELAQYKNYHKVLQQEVGDEAVADKSQFILQCIKEITQIKEDIIELEAKIKIEEIQKKKQEESVQEKTLLIAQWSNEKQNQEKESEKYITHKERVQNMLLRIGKSISHMWEEREECVLTLQKQLDQLIRDKEKLALIVQRQRERVEDLQTYDYFIPHKTLLRIKEELEKNQIYVVLGSEWLSQQALEEEDKENVLENNRLLPYSILVEEGQIKQVERVLRTLKGERFEIPIIFQVKEKLITSFKTDMPILMSMQRGVMVFQPLEKKLFASRAEMQRILQEEERQLHTNIQNLNQYRELEALLQTVFREITSFFETYDNRFEERVKQQINLLQVKGEKAEQQIEEIRADISLCEQQIVDMKEKCRQLEKQKYTMRTQLEKVEAFCKLYFDIQSVKDRHIKAQADLISVEKELTMAERRQEEIRRRQMQMQRLVDDHQHQRKQHEDVRNLYGFLYELVEGEVTTGDYETARITFEQLNKRMEQENGSYEHIRKLLTAAQRNEIKEQEVIQTLAVCWEWLKYQQRSITATEVEEAKNSEEKAEETLRTMEKEMTQVEKEVYGKEEKWKTECDAVKRVYKKEPHVFGEDAKEEQRCAIRELTSSYEEQEKLEFKYKQKEEEWRAVCQVLEAFQDIADLPVCTELTMVLPTEEWKSIYSNPMETFRKLKRETETAKSNFEQQRIRVRRAFQQYIECLEMTNNHKVKIFADQFTRLLEGEKLFDYEYIHSKFLRVFESLAAMKRQHEHMLVQSESDKKELVNLMYQRIVAVYENIKEIPRHSKIQLYSMPFEMIKMDWKREEEETALQNLLHWVDTLLHHVQKMHQSGKNEEEIDLFMKQQLRTEKMLDSLAPIPTCQIKVFKPRKQTLMESGIDYMPWHIAAKWSGGEQYTSYMTMFMVLITHIRKKRFTKENSWKFIIADNPFGKASSEHVVSPIIELAQKCNIQLMCLTAIKEEGLRRHFDVVTSNRYYHVGGKEILSKQEQVTSLKSLYYKKPVVI